jgi:hypothetical protein
VNTFRQHALLTEERDHVTTIRNLMALASRPGTAAEGIIARQQAERLAEKHGIDLATLQPDPAPIPRQPSPGATAAQPARKPISDEYMAVLRKFGWRIERRPQSLMFVTDRPGMYDHQIEITPDGWTHYISGMIRFAGQTPRDLQQHMHLHVT